MARGVTIDHVTFGYGATPVLEDISLDVERGQFFAFLGPSGSGKTTLLAPDRRLRHADRRPHPDRRARRDAAAALEPQRRHGVPELRAVAAHERRARTSPSGSSAASSARAEIERKVADALALVGLSAFADRRPAQLSGGQQQRVALARTIVIEPEVLLLDEPLSNLDARLRVEMRVELRQLQRKLGITAIYVTHDQEDANSIADNIAVLDQGRIQQIGTPIELYDRPANRFVATFLGTANLIEGTIEPDGRFVADGIALPNVGGAAGPGLHLDPPAGHFRRAAATAALPPASPSASSSAASRAITRRPARSRSWSTCRTAAARAAHEVGETIG